MSMKEKIEDFGISEIDSLVNSVKEQMQAIRRLRDIAESDTAGSVSEDLSEEQIIMPILAMLIKELNHGPLETDGIKKVVSEMVDKAEDLKYFKHFKENSKENYIVQIGNQACDEWFRDDDGE